MAIGERIRFIRNLRGMTQKFLGLQVGFSERTADIRMAQYESGSRTPKADLVEQLADALDVSAEALNVPNIDSYTGLMHTLFALEDLYGFKIDRLDGEICIRINRQNGSTFAKMTGLLKPWEEMATAMGRSAVRSMISGGIGIRGQRRSEMKLLVGKRKVSKCLICTDSNILLKGMEVTLNI